MYTPDEAREIRGLLAARPARRAEELMARARLRRIGWLTSSDPRQPTLAMYEQQLADGAITIESGNRFNAEITPHPSVQQIFRVAVGVTGRPVPAGWNAFEQRYQWFGKEPKQVTSGAHLFVLAVDRWKSAVVGLYEAVSPGAVKLPGSPDENRWPYALGVRPIAAISPPVAVRVEGQRGPQSGLPEHVFDPDAHRHLYAAVRDSLPPPEPHTLEQRVQELQALDIEPDILQAIQELGRRARQPEIVSRALELGEWSPDELSARTWYTGMGPESHIENVTVNALRLAEGKGRVAKTHGIYACC